MVIEMAYEGTERNKIKYQVQRTEEELESLKAITFG